MVPCWRRVGGGAGVGEGVGVGEVWGRRAWRRLGKSARVLASSLDLLVHFFGPLRTVFSRELEGRGQWSALARGVGLCFGFSVGPFPVILIWPLGERVLVLERKWGNGVKRHRLN